MSILFLSPSRPLAGTNLHGLGFAKFHFPRVVQTRLLPPDTQDPKITRHTARSNQDSDQARDISTHRSRQFLPFQAISNIFHGLFPPRDSRLRQTKRIRRLAKGIINDKCEPGPKGKEEHQAGAGPVEIQSGESNTAVLHQEGKEQIRGSIEVDPLGP